MCDMQSRSSLIQRLNSKLKCLNYRLAHKSFLPKFVVAVRHSITSIDSFFIIWLLHFSLHTSRRRLSCLHVYSSPLSFHKSNCQE